jgi:hypothetical protein
LEAQVVLIALEVVGTSFQKKSGRRTRALSDPERSPKKTSVLALALLPRAAAQELRRHATVRASGLLMRCYGSWAPGYSIATAGRVQLLHIGHCDAMLQDQV